MAGFVAGSPEAGSPEVGRLSLRDSLPDPHFSRFIACLPVFFTCFAPFSTSPQIVLQWANIESDGKSA